MPSPPRQLRFHCWYGDRELYRELGIEPAIVQAARAAGLLPFSLRAGAAVSIGYSVWKWLQSTRQAVDASAAGQFDRQVAELVARGTPASEARRYLGKRCRRLYRAWLVARAEVPMSAARFYSAEEIWVRLGVSEGELLADRERRSFPLNRQRDPRGRYAYRGQDLLLWVVQGARVCRDPMKRGERRLVQRFEAQVAASQDAGVERERAVEQLAAEYPIAHTAWQRSAAVRTGLSIPPAPGGTADAAAA
jgi:hypothetical protein